MVKKTINRTMAENVVQLALENGALIKQEEFLNFDRALILTPNGMVAIRSPKDESSQDCEITDFHGMDRDLNDIRNEFLQIRIKGLFN